MGTEIEFVGYAADCRVEGCLELEADRLSDMLSLQPSVRLRHVVLTSIADGHAETLDELEIGREELDAVVASGPRGNPARRVATRPSEVQVKTGPYFVGGVLHGLPAADAIRGFARKPAMVPLTDARLEYDFCAERVMERFETLLVNRDLAASVELVPLRSTTPVG